MGLGRRNNEFNELTNCVDALGRQGNNEIYLASLLKRNIFGLGRRNNEFNELTNFGDALGVNCGASAPEGGSYLG